MAGVAGAGAGSLRVKRGSVDIYRRILRAPALKCPETTTPAPTVEAHILVVDDDPAIRDLINEYLTENDFKVSVAETGADMDKVLSVEIVDLVILDLKLPDEDGLAIARRLRESLDLPIIILTGRKEEADRIMGLELGADDYVTKPFSNRELLARVRAVLRRTGRVSAPLVAGEILVDEETGIASRAGRELALTGTELRLLAYIVRHRGRVLSKHQLLTQVWGYDAYDPNVVEVHISALRRKLETQGPRVIETVRGLGYRLAVR